MRLNQQSKNFQQTKAQDQVALKANFIKHLKKTSQTSPKNRRRKATNFIYKTNIAMIKKSDKNTQKKENYQPTDTEKPQENISKWNPTIC